MKKLKFVFGLYAVMVSMLLSFAATAEEAQRQHKKPCPPGEECVAQRKQLREERRQKKLEEKCHGDQACESKMKQKFEERRAKVKAAIEQKCGQNPTQECRQSVRKQMIQEFKEKHAQHRKDEASSN